MRGTPDCGSAIGGWRHKIAGGGIAAQFLHEDVHHRDKKLLLLHATGALILSEQLVNSLQIATVYP
jgi:hypothetical protein